MYEMITTTILKWPFQLIGELEPRRNDDGTIETRMPQQRYKNANSTPVHRYGWGPFCKLSISDDWYEKSGVYALTADDRFQYVGETKNLGRQVNHGFGHISPRNCFKGGQETNCRINSLIRESAIEGDSINLFFHETDDRKNIKQKLISNLSLPWNKKGSGDQETSTEDRNEQKSHGKYTPLYDYLRDMQKQRIELSFSEIEDILGFSFPESAYQYPAWWSNGSHSHSAAWLDAGWEVAEYSFSDTTVRFEKSAD